MQNKLTLSPCIAGIQRSSISRMKKHLINVLAALVFSGLSLFLMSYAIGSMRNPDKEVAAPDAIQSLSNNITAQVGIKSVGVVVRHRMQTIAQVQCPSSAPKCKIVIDDEIASRMPTQASAIAGIIAHEIGHIVEPPLPWYIQILPIFLSINCVLLTYVYLMGWKPAILIFAILGALVALHDINSTESASGFTSALLLLLLVLGMIIWPVQLKSRTNIVVAVAVILMLGQLVLKYPLRRGEANADLFALRIVGKASVTRALCLLREENKRGDLGVIRSTYLEWLDTHPSLEERFIITKISANGC